MVINRDECTCQSCGCKNKRMVVHHIKGFEHFPHLRFDIDNGITLCIKCHNHFHKLYGKSFFPDIRSTEFYINSIYNKNKKEVVNE